MRTVNVDGGRVGAAESGTGKPLILLHSLLAERSIFDGIVEYLARERRVIVLDLPGFGLSTGVEADISLFADRIAGALHAMALPPDCDLLGNGLGAFVALTLANRHGARINRLVLAGVGVAFPDAGKAAFRSMAATVEREGLPAIVPTAIGRLFPEDYVAAHTDVMRHRAEAFLQTDPALFASLCRMLAGLDLSDTAVGVRNPTLIVVGDRDAATPPPMGKALAARIAGAQYLEMDGLGHAPMAQDPAAFVAAIGEFLGLGQHADIAGQ